MRGTRLGSGAGGGAGAAPDVLGAVLAEARGAAPEPLGAGLPAGLGVALAVRGSGAEGATGSLGGQKVSLTYFHEPEQFSPTRRELSMVTLTSPSHGVWTSEGGDLSELGNPPLHLSRSKVVCSTSEECGSYERYDIDAVEPLTMSTVNVPHGQTGRFGPWVIVHGGYAAQTSADSPCSDWYVADVRVAILGLM